MSKMTALAKALADLDAQIASLTATRAFLARYGAEAKVEKSARVRKTKAATGAEVGQ